MNDFWNKRYASNKYVYGIEPNKFFKKELDKLNAGKLLLPGEGEGRQAVYASLNGWNVIAFDTSIKAKEKTEQLAEANKTKINYSLLNYSEVNSIKNSFDAIALIYTHSMPEIRVPFHKKLLTLLKPGGTLILECFSKEQINYNSGGPQNIEMLYSEKELINDFSTLSEINISSQLIALNEGEYHVGTASVVRILGKK